MRLVRVEREGGVTAVTLDRPFRHNSLVPELLEQLCDAWQAAEADPEVRACVLAAEGRSFSTGGDVRAFSEHAGGDLAGYASTTVGLLNRAILSMVELPVPIVAAVHGMVTGGSLGLVLAADLVLVAPEATFTPWYGVVGFAPDGGWTAMLPDVIGRSRAADVLYGNRTIDADLAVAWGVANRVVPAERLRDEAVAVAGAIAGMVPGAIRHAKRGLWPDVDRLATRLEAERRRFVEQVVTEEARAGMERFLGS